MNVAELICLLQNLDEEHQNRQILVHVEDIEGSCYLLKHEDLGLTTFYPDDSTESIPCLMINVESIPKQDKIKTH